MDLSPYINQLIRQITIELSLTYIDLVESGDNVCYANTPGLRPEYRQTFTYTDVLNYLYAIFHLSTDNQQYGKQLTTQTGNLPYPTDSATFWKMTETGSQIRISGAVTDNELYQRITQYLQSK